MKKKDKLFIKIPNDFFYDDGGKLENIGGRNSFVLYCLITIRKNINNHTYLTIKEIDNILQIDKNIHRSKKIIINCLQLLKKYELINFNINIKDVNNTDSIKIEWINLFPNKDDFGWIKFYADDFDIFDKVGIILYCTMWILRMYKNHESNTSFIAINDISSILKCRTKKVQYSIDLFEYTNLFDIIRGNYYYNEGYGRNIKKNNEYKYTGNIDVLMNTDDKDIKEILFSKTNENTEDEINKLLS